jgi:hypothetical protein
MIAIQKSGALFAALDSYVCLWFEAEKHQFDACEGRRNMRTGSTLEESAFFTAKRSCAVH